MDFSFAQLDLKLVPLAQQLIDAGSFEKGAQAMLEDVGTDSDELGATHGFLPEGALDQAVMYFLYDGTALSPKYVETQARALRGYTNFCLTLYEELPFIARYVPLVMRKFMDMTPSQQRSRDTATNTIRIGQHNIDIIHEIGKLVLAIHGSNSPILAEFQSKLACTSSAKVVSASIAPTATHIELCEDGQCITIDLAAAIELNSHDLRTFRIYLNFLRNDYERSFSEVRKICMNLLAETLGLGGCVTTNFKLKTLGE